MILPIFESVPTWSVDWDLLGVMGSKMPPRDPKRCARTRLMSRQDGRADKLAAGDHLSAVSREPLTTKPAQYCPQRPPFNVTTFF